MKSRLEKDENGFPILLAQAPGQVAAQPPASGLTIQRDTKAGNPWHDPTTGKFSNSPINMKIISGNNLFPDLLNVSRRIIQARIEELNPNAIALFPHPQGVTVVLMRDLDRLAAFVVPTKDTPVEQIDLPALEQQGGVASEGEPGISPPRRSDIPVGVDEAQWERRIDAIRDAARENDDMDAGDAKEFLRGRVKDLSMIDIDQFLVDVREQRLDDLIDILDHQLRQRVEGMRRARRIVRTVAPKGWVKRVFTGLSDSEIIKLLTRLEGRGWDIQDLRQHVLGRIKDEERVKLIEVEFGSKKKDSKES